MAAVAQHRSGEAPFLGFLGRVRHTLHIASNSTTNSNENRTSNGNKHDQVSHDRRAQKIARKPVPKGEKENAAQQPHMGESEKVELLLGPNGSVSNTRVQRRRSLWKKVCVKLAMAVSDEGSQELSSSVEQTPSLPTKSSLSDLPPTLSLSFDDQSPPDEARLSEGKAAAHSSTDSSSSRKGGLLLGRRSMAAKSDKGGAKPSPAAEVALAASSLSASSEAQIKYHRNARLKVKQTASLVQMCSQQIKMRGLATIGIFRPFRAAESIEQQERLIELFLLYSEPKVYSSVFAAAGESIMLLTPGGSELMRGTMGQSDIEAELRRTLAYANIYDVVALLKWGLRRLRVKAEDLGCSAEQPYAWYDAFVAKEKVAGYPKVAYSTLLLPSLPSAMCELLETMLDLMSTVSSHNIANAMPAARICRSLGFWLVDRIESDRPAQDLEGVLQSWEKSALIMEHLLMAYIRDQSTRNHLMPSRLMEIAAEYPQGSEGAPPRLPPSFSSHPVKALLVEVESTGITISPKRPRGPSETLRAALKAQGSDLEASEEVDDWSAVLGMACISEEEVKRDNGVETETPKDGSLADGLDARKESLLFSPEDARVLRVVAAELDRKSAKWEPRDVEKKDSDVTTPPKVERGPLTTSVSNPTYGSTANSFADHTAGQFVGLRPSHSHLATLVEDSPVRKSRSPVDWDTFSSGGFEADGKEEGTLDSMLGKLYQPVKDAPPAEPRVEERLSSNVRRRASLGTLRRKRLYESQAGSMSSLQLAETALSARRDKQTPAQPLKHVLQKVSSINIDQSFSDFWQDQLLDDCVCARLPYLVVAHLSIPTAGRLLGSWVGHSTTNEPILLLICETCIPPRPLLPQSASHNGTSGGAGRGLGSILRRSNFSVSSGLNDDGRSEKRSLIAPSIRSTFTTGLEKTKLSLRRMSTLLSSGSRQAEREKIDQEIAELQEAVQSKRVKSSLPRENGEQAQAEPKQDEEHLADQPGKDRDVPIPTYSSTTGVASRVTEQPASRPSSGASHYQSADDKSHPGSL